MKRAESIIHFQYAFIEGGKLGANSSQTYLKKGYSHKKLVESINTLKASVKKLHPLIVKSELKVYTVEEFLEIGKQQGDCDTVARLVEYLRDETKDSKVDKFTHLKMGFPYET